MTGWALYLLLLRATLTSFSGFASVPVVRDDLVVHRQVLTDDQLNAAIAIGQSSPGPLGLYVVVVGYFVAGWAGAVAGMCALATPAILAIPILRASYRGRTQTVATASAAIVIAASTLMAVAAARLIPTATPTVPLAVIGLVSLGTLTTLRVGPIYVIIGAGVLGLLM
jgi:chromate transporter